MQIRAFSTACIPDELIDATPQAHAVIRLDQYHRDLALQVDDARSKVVNKIVEGTTFSRTITREDLRPLYFALKELDLIHPDFRELAEAAFSDKTLPRGG